MRMSRRATVACVCINAALTGCGALPVPDDSDVTLSLGPPIYDRPVMKVVGGPQALSSDAHVVEISLELSAVGDADLPAFASCEVGKIAEQNDFAFSRVPPTLEIRPPNAASSASEAQLRAILYRSLHGVSKREQVVATELRLVKCDEI
ncbi:MAG: hypothetical protein KTR21_04490 [Rhodobacteraceae bacterium]|nr:hypothetical protein [Paracoccaceae bacterium]